MPWSERQIAMLGEMGLRLPPQTHFVEQDRSPLPPSARGEGEAVASPDAGGVAPVRAAPIAVRAELVEASNPIVTPTPVVARGNRPTGIDTMDWPALREAVVACTACKLCETRRQTVFGVGNQQSHWMVVGEAPGEQEDIQGEPFVGKSGQLLDNMLKALGLGRKDATPPDPSRQVYIANTLKCRPPGNRNPQPEELAQCEHFLIRQIELVKPRIILAMGRFAVQSLLRSTEPIGRLRGRVHRYQGVPLIVTYHPAYLLRNLEDKARAWDDLCLAAETASG
ncbi:uracil-DNA glycosylase [Piscinibacter terrae]|uniref:Type-4 uracil-DNA glycosylase n=1 Tax=Piscinibacter terrae TaxID=2496871 RepID=A0A3N7K0T9_9BURK|nr:uracil-DNA glycosylase [Albitalea terrae]RQP26619.1 uracil-DNA glycosylase [Albitalea terrae]